MEFNEYDCARCFCNTLRTLLYVDIKGRVKCFVQAGTLYIEIENGSTIWRTNQHDIYPLIRLGLRASSVADEVLKQYKRYIHNKYFL